jgi:hypothetical protein
MAAVSPACFFLLPLCAAIKEIHIQISNINIPVTISAVSGKKQLPTFL